MDPKSQERFDLILIKDLSAVTPSDIVFLKARRTYLTLEQRAKYLDVLNERVVVSPEGKRNESLNRFRELRQRAKERGINVPKGTKLAELEKLLS